MKKFTLAVAALCIAASSLAQAPAQAPDYSSYTWKDLGEGTMSDFVLCNLVVGFFNDPVKVQVQESEQVSGVYRILKPWSAIENVPFDESLNQIIIDASDPEYVKVPAQKAPIETGGLGETWYCSYTYWGEEIIGKKDLFIEMQPDKVLKLKDGVIKFTQNCMAVMYPEGEDSASGIAPGVWTYTNMEYEGYLVLPDGSGEVAEEWNDLGTGRFLDGFLERTFDPSYTPVELEVQIMENKNVPGVYKVVDAFKHSAATGRDLILDARQPDFVRIEEQNTGVNTTNGWLYILSVSTNGEYTTYQEMVDAFPSYAERNITKDERGIYIPTNSILFTFPTSGDYVCYPTTDALYSYIIFPGYDSIESVGADETDGPAEYFNLQGIRVESPVAGQLMIVRKGTKTYKTIIR